MVFKTAINFVNIRLNKTKIQINLQLTVMINPRDLFKDIKGTKNKKTKV